ncbi:MAG: radical SAM protein [Chloroflexota bacterium]
MHFKIEPDAITKLTQMGDVTLFEPAGDQPQNERTPTKMKDEHRQPSLTDCIAHLKTPKGAKPVLKTMMTTACERNCFYCPFRAGHSGTKRMTIQPDELAKAFDTLQASKKVDGLFLSSGIIKGGVTAQDKILDTVDMVRNKYNYRGYVHLKIMPGADDEQIRRAMQLADRISINMEGATEERLSRLAPKKDFFGELLKALQTAHHFKQTDYTARASIVTQFVVGAVGDTDLELLSLSDRLYNQLGLARTYFSPFSPIVGTPFENLTATELIREHRLYQASFLLRDYAWDVEELPFIESGNLRTDIDPKLAWAEVNLVNNPIEIMTADKLTLMRLPNVGAKSADNIIKARQQTALRDFGQLGRLGIRTPEQLAPYVLLDGKRPLQQKKLF